MAFEEDSQTDQGLAAAFLQLVGIVARLRDVDGCPWDREQTHESVARNIPEEAAETVDAIESGDLDSLKEELGDLLLQVVLQSQIALEAEEFTLADVIDEIAKKLVRRHPHVFGVEASLEAMDLKPEERQFLADQAQSVENPLDVLELWDNIKLLEHAQAGQSRGLLDSVPKALPALMQAQDISRKAISQGFDWPDVSAVWSQVYAEIDEYKSEPSGSPKAQEEYGDVLFSLVNVALKEGIDAESALRGTINRFRMRWAIMEAYAANEGKELSGYSVTEQEALWQKAKQDIALL
ncbi:MAG: nucleoside triphosphate pyrophosphohydrolase [Coriobacteriia bacterium]|nr:nucleoside triphosphate pyrophosphohydrolase [Coriobacteriia bacterium]